MPSAVVTGAGRGLGAAIAAALAQRGFHVHVTDVDEGAAKATASSIGADAVGVALDVTDAAACQELATAVVRADGSLDLWVNNAGVLSTGSSWSHAGAAAEAMLRVNSLGTINGTLAALEVMRLKGSGQVINVVSLAGIFPTPGEAIYSASKHAALAFSLATSADLRAAKERGVRISCLCPDGIWTPMLHPKLHDPTAAASFSGSMLTPEQVTAALMSLVDRPRLVLAVPRARGVIARIAATFPRFLVWAAPHFLADGRRKQRKFAKQVDAGDR